MPDQLDDHPVAEVEVASLTVTGSPRTTGENAEHVELLAASQDDLPPIIVHRPTMRVVDGAHRLRAAVLCGRETIAVRFVDGTETDAFVLAVRLNVAHGLPLSLADRKRAAGRIITSHPMWSDRMIASVAGISAKTVAELRKATGTGRAVARIGKDGRVRSVDGAAGRRLAYDLILQDPNLSLRQIARAAGISPETARDVRNRLSRGEGPLPTGRTVTSRTVAAAVTAPRPLVGPLPSAGRRFGVVGPITPRRLPAQQPAVIVERLKADPALRFNENGRDLLRLLNIHTIGSEDWGRIIDSVPPHCRGIVAQLARECAEIWTDFAQRIERTVPTMT